VLEIIEAASDAGVRARWVVGDEIYGSDGNLHGALEERSQAYAPATKSHKRSTAWPPYAPRDQASASTVAAALETEAWQRMRCGAGAEGERLFDSAYIPLRPALPAGGVHALLIRRPVEADEVGYYLVYAPVDMPLAEVMRAVGAGWAIEGAFKLSDGQLGLDHREVRPWAGWHGHVTLAPLALAILAMTAGHKGSASGCASCSDQHPRAPPPHDPPPGPGPASSDLRPSPVCLASLPRCRPRLPHQTPTRRPR
jgi:SRSO17 transposase